MRVEAVLRLRQRFGLQRFDGQQERAGVEAPPPCLLLSHRSDQPQLTHHSSRTRASGSNQALPTLLLLLQPPPSCIACPSPILLPLLPPILLLLLPSCAARPSPCVCSQASWLNAAVSTTPRLLPLRREAQPHPSVCARGLCLRGWQQRMERGWVTEGVNACWTRADGGLCDTVLTPRRRTGSDLEGVYA